jgi:hypothetical protein
MRGLTASPPEKRPSRKVTLLSLAGLVLAGVLAAQFFPLSEGFVIRHDLHLGKSPVIIAAPASEPQSISVAIASLSNSTKQALLEQHTWHEAAANDWYRNIPWFSDLVISTQFDPILHDARNMRTTRKLESHHETSQWIYDLILDDGNNILWIVKDIANASERDSRPL